MNLLYIVSYSLVTGETGYWLKYKILLFFLKISHFHFFKNKVERFKLSGFPVSPVTPVTQD